jgi:hypothetical protein
VGIKQIYLQAVIVYTAKHNEKIPRRYPSFPYYSTKNKLEKLKTNSALMYFYYLYSLTTCIPLVCTIVIRLMKKPPERDRKRAFITV